MRPRLLDLFCGAGGCSEGYFRAGFDIVGVDINPQPNYPFEFVQTDALEYLAAFRDGKIHYRAAAIHASPPCQAFTAYQRTGNVGEYPDYIALLRELLEQTELPYVIENVVGAPLDDAVLLCGSMFDMDIQRHRLFETNWELAPPDWPCRHKLWAPDRYPGGRSVERTGSSTGLVRASMEIGAWDIPLAKQQDAMGIGWMTLEELSEAVPPTYTEHIGVQLMAHLTAPRIRVGQPKTGALTSPG